MAFFRRFRNGAVDRQNLRIILPQDGVKGVQLLHGRFQDDVCIVFEFPVHSKERCGDLGFRNAAHRTGHGAAVVLSAGPAGVAGFRAPAMKGCSAVSAKDFHGEWTLVFPLFSPLSFTL